MDHNACHESHLIFPHNGLKWDSGLGPRRIVYTACLPPPGPAVIGGRDKLHVDVRDGERLIWLMLWMVTVSSSWFSSTLMTGLTTVLLLWSLSVSGTSRKPTSWLLSLLLHSSDRGLSFCCCPLQDNWHWQLGPHSGVMCDLCSEKWHLDLPELVTVSVHFSDWDICSGVRYGLASWDCCVVMLLQLLLLLSAELWRW
jgi:hypothetical protein